MGHLVAVLHSLPGGNGTRTKSRVEVARHALRCQTASIVNLYPAPLANSNGLTQSHDPVVWSRGREAIAAEVGQSATTDVILGYGVQAPTGAARRAFTEQVAWLDALLRASGLRVWTVGAATHHPSRWQRVTFREAPDVPFASAVEKLLTQRTFPFDD